MSDWQAKVDYDPVMDADLVTIWRRVGDQFELVVPAGDESFAIRRYPEHVVPDEGPLRLPRGAANAIALAITGTSSDTLAALGEALDIERRRVDMVLERLTARREATPSDGSTS